MHAKQKSASLTGLRWLGLTGALLGIFLALSPTILSYFVARYPEILSSHLAPHLHHKLSFSEFSVSWQRRGLRLEARNIVVHDAFAAASDDLEAGYLSLDLDLLASLRRREPILSHLALRDVQVNRGGKARPNYPLVSAFELQLETAQSRNFHGELALLGPIETSFPFAGSLREGNWRQGRIALSPAAAKFAALPYIDARLPPSQVAGELSWRYGDAIVLRLTNVVLSNALASLSFNGQAELTEQRDLNFDLKLKSLAPIQIADFKRLLPYGLLDAELSLWLKNALSSGLLRSSNTSIRGSYTPSAKPKQAPFFSKLQLSSDIHVEDAALKFHPEWPALHVKRAKLELSERGLRLSELEARPNELPALDLHLSAGACQLDFDDPILHVEAHVRGDGRAAERYLRQSPLKASLAALWDSYELSGPSELGLALHIPLDARPFTMASTWHLHDNRLHSKATGLSVEQLSGEIQLSEDSLSSEHLSGQIAGLDASTRLAIASFSAPILTTKVDFRVHAAAAKAAESLKSVQRALGLAAHPTLSGSLSFTNSEAGDCGISGQIGDALLVELRGNEFWEGRISKQEPQAAPQLKTEGTPGWLEVELAELHGRVQLRNTPGKLFAPAEVRAVFHDSNFDFAGAEGEQPASGPTLPHLHFDCQDCSFNGLALQAVSLELIPADGGYQLHHAYVTRQDVFSLDLTAGFLSGPPPFTGAAAQGQLDIKNLGNFLKLFDITSELSGFLGRINFDVSYAGPLVELTPKHLSGAAELSFIAGAAHKDNKFIARLLELITFNVQEMFSDKAQVHQVAAGLTIQQGVVATQNLYLKLSSLLLKYQGSVNLVDQTAKGQARIYLNINRTVSSLLAFLVNPLLAISLIGQETPQTDETFLNQLTSTSYLVTGPWDALDLSFYGR